MKMLNFLIPFVISLITKHEKSSSSCLNYFKYSDGHFGGGGAAAPNISEDNSLLF